MLMGFDAGSDLLKTYAGARTSQIAESHVGRLDKGPYTRG